MKQKMMVGILVVLMLTVSMVGVLNSSVRAFDTNPTPFGYIAPSFGGTSYTVRGVAWDDNGTHAMMVGDDYATDLDWYAQSITNISGMASSSVNLYDVAYYPATKTFYTVGGESGNVAAYKWADGGSTMSHIDTNLAGTSGTFKKMAMGDFGFMTIGNGSGGSPSFYYYNITAESWTSVNLEVNHPAYAVSFVHKTFFIFTGADSGTDVYTVMEGDAEAGTTPQFAANLPEVAVVYDAATNGNDVTVVGRHTSGDGCILTFNGYDGSVEDEMLVRAQSLSGGYNLEFYSIAWDSTGRWATIVGYDDGAGSVVYTYQSRHSYAARLDYSGSDAPLAVAIRPPHSPSSSTIVGSGSGGATTLSTTTASQQITTTTVYPHIHYIDIYDNSSNSYMNRQMNVDEGSATDEFYYIEVNASYGSSSSGLDWSDIDTVDVYAWFDDGKTSTTGTAYGSGAENTQFHFQYKYNSSASTFTFSKIYPSTGEVQFFPAACSDIGWDAYNHTLRFAFAPQQQVHNGSAGQEGGNAAPDNRYNNMTGTWQPGVQNTINALNDPYTWDMHVHVVDNTGNAYADAYDEFGIYKFTDLGAWSVPGDLSAAGAPNTPGVALKESGVNATFDLTYRSNCQYQIRVYMDDALKSSTTSDFIPATALKVFGGNMTKALYFQGIGASNSIYIVGNVTGVEPQPTGTETTTTQEGAALQWTVDIPTVAEATYSANAVYEILHA